MSITPAFSPGTWITHGAVVGSFFSHTFEDLYEQCSLHIAEKMPSSTMVGVRPMILSRRSYSSGARPCSATTCGVIVGSFGSLTGGFFSAAIVTTQYSREGLDNTFEQRFAVGAAEHRFGGILRMRHQAHHGLGLVEDAGDVADRSVGITGTVDRAVRRAVTEGDLAAVFQLLQRVVVGEVVALGMRHRDLDHLARLVAVGEQALAGLDLQVHVCADELQVRVAHQRARQKPCLGHDLEAVADAQHRHALGGAALHFGHHRRLRGHRAAAEIIAVGEAARHHDEIGLLEIAVAVPHHVGEAAGDELDRLRHVAFAIGAGENKHRRFHQPTSSIEKFSITVLASSFLHISSSRAFALALSVSASSSSMNLPWRTSPTSGKPSRLSE